jgi:flagellar biosynthetic protein FliP
VIVLSFVRRAWATTELPPNPVLIGLSLFLTGAVMAPVGKEIHAKAIALPRRPARLRARRRDRSGELKHFLLRHARGDLALFLEMSNSPAPEGRATCPRPSCRRTSSASCAPPSRWASCSISRSS